MDLQLSKYIYQETLRCMLSDVSNVSKNLKTSSNVTFFKIYFLLFVPIRYFTACMEIKCDQFLQHVFNEVK